MHSRNFRKTSLAYKEKFIHVTWTVNSQHCVKKLLGLFTLMPLKNKSRKLRGLRILNNECVEMYVNILSDYLLGTIYKTANNSVS